jgi:hypothetical protein
LEIKTESPATRDLRKKVEEREKKCHFPKKIPKRVYAFSCILKFYAIFLQRRKTKNGLGEIQDSKHN